MQSKNNLSGNNNPIKIAVDAMGGDFAPYEVIKGALSVLPSNRLEIILVGRTEVINEQISRLNFHGAKPSIVEARQVIEYHEAPMRAIKEKKDSSIVEGMNLLKRGEVDAFLSAGNTGAVMAAALFYLGKLDGIERPAIGALYPTMKGTALLLDIGANVDCRPNFLVQFAQLGSTYTERVQGIKRPRVALLNNGEESHKGNRLIRESFNLLEKSGVNFIGNVEGKDILQGVADVIVTDGFTGNILVKTSEGFGEFMTEIMKKAISDSLYMKLAIFFFKPALKAFSEKWDYTERGGAPLLGVNGNVIIAHGRSKSKAIANAIKLAKQAVEHKALEALKGEL